MRLTRSLATRVRQSGKKLAHAMEHCSMTGRLFVKPEDQERAKRVLAKAWDNFNQVCDELDSVVEK